MNDSQRQLEERIDRELKALPELQAPPALTARILAVVGHRAAQPWYRRPWVMWPVGLRAGSLALVLALFGGMCWGGSELARTLASTSAMQSLAGQAAELRLLVRTLGVLGDAAVLSLWHLGTVWLAAIFTALFLMYAACVGLGTVSLRLALARSDKTDKTWI
jgi:hypothetical protein